MIAPTQIRKPENWQDFEKLCKKLWGEIWKCSDTVQRNGRAGQDQCGVDVYGILSGAEAYYGIQCKGKDDYTKSKLTEKEIDAEIEKALKFEPPLKRLIFATTANKDVKIETYIRTLNIKHIKSGLFEVVISSWEDITDLLEEHIDTYNWYVNNCQYKDASDVEVYFDWENEIEINPQYISETIFYIFENPDSPFAPIRALQKGHFGLSTPTIYPKKKIDYRWCNFNVNIKNTGSTVIEEYKLILIFDPDCIQNLSGRISYVNSFHLSDAAKAQINIGKDSSREVFAGKEFEHIIECKPQKAILVQDDYKSFRIGVKPKDDITEIKVAWQVLSRNYKKSGNLSINVAPTYEKSRRSVIVSDKSEVKVEETIIPKIIEN